MNPLSRSSALAATPAAAGKDEKTTLLRTHGKAAVRFARFACFLLLLARTCTALMAQSGATKVSASIGPAAPYFTDDVTATVTVAASSSPVPTGSISGTVDGGPQKSVPLSNGVARVNLAFFAPGAHSFVYTYSGDGTYAASSPQTLSFTVADRPFAPIGGESIFLNGLSPGTNLYNFTAAVDSSDNVYLTDPTTNTLYKADPAGVLTVIPTTGLNLPDGLTLDKSGNIFIADVNNARIVEVSASGQQSVVPITGLVKPVNVAFDPAYKSLYVVDQGNSTVVVYDVATKTQTSINPGISPINGIAIDATGNLYLSGGSGQGDIYRRDTAGNVVDLYAGTSDPQGLLLDGKGNLYISSGYGLFLLDTQGHLTQLNFQGLGEGVISGVLLMHSFAMDSRGQIYYPNGQTFRFIPGAGGNSGLVDTYDQANAAPEQNPAYEYLSDFRVYYQAPYQVTFTNLAFAPGNVPFGAPGRNTLGFSGSPGLAPFLDILSLQNAPILPGPYSTYVTLTTSDGKQYTSIIYGVGRGYEFAIAPGTVTSQSPSVSSIGGVTKDANGNIYVSDPAGGQVLEISPTATTKVPFTGLNNPTDLAVDATGAVYVLDSGSSRILRVDNAGNQTVAFDLKQQSALTSLSAFAMDGGADFYLAGDAASGQAAIYYLNSLGTQTLAAGNIALPSAVAVGELGTVYSVEAGGILRHFDLAGNSTELASGLPTPTSLAVDVSGTVYVTGEAGSGVTVVYPDGTKAAYPASALVNASAVAVDNGGNLTVGDSTDKEVFSVNRQQGQSYNYDFGNVAVGSTKTTAGYLSNVGNVVSLGYTITPATDPFAWATGSQACVAAEPTADAPLSPGQFCDFTLSFTPTALGDFSNTLYVRDSPSGNQLFPIMATGTATAGTGAPALSFSPASITFPSTTAGSTSAAQTLTLKNAGSATANITSIGIVAANPSSFRLNSACGSTLAVNAACTVTVTFSPATANTTDTASVSAASDDPHSPTVATLSGSSPPATASPTATLTPAAVNFGSVTAGQSASQTLTLTNTGTVSLTISSHGSLGTPFSLSGSTCASTLAAGATCTYSILYSPTTAGTSTGSFSVTDSAGSQTSTLTGMATAGTAPAATLTPSKLDFGSILTGTKATAQTATLTNTGTAVLTISGISLTGANSAAFTTTNACGGSLAAGASCAISVVFAPTAPGTDAATLSVSDDAAGSPQTSTLTGVATAPPPAADFNLTATPASQSVTAGASAAYRVTVSAMNGNFSDAVALGASGLPAGATVTFAPASVTPGSSSAASTMTIQTVAQQTALANHSPKWPVPVGVVSVALLILPFRRRKHFLLSLRGLGCFLLLMVMGGALSGCGGGFALPQTKPASTTYTVTVTGTSGSLQHSTSVQITVR